MTAFQEATLRSLIRELADKHGDRALRAQAQQVAKRSLLAAAIAATYADHWSSKRACDYFFELGFRLAQFERAFNRHHEAAARYRSWQPSFN